MKERLRSQGPVGNSNSAIDKFISLPVEIQLQVVPHLSPDDLIKLIRILNAYDPSNSLCSAVDIIGRPSDLNRRSCKPIKVIFITSLFKSESQYQTLVKRSQKSLNFVLMRGAAQDSPSLVWLPKFLTGETIGHRTKIHVSGHIQSLDFREISITSCGLYSESLARLAFRRCEVLEFCISGIDSNRERSFLSGIGEVLVSSGLGRRSDRRTNHFIRYLWC